jgi:hypothetical protein
MGGKETEGETKEGSGWAYKQVFPHSTYLDNYWIFQHQTAISLFIHNYNSEPPVTKRSGDTARHAGFLREGTYLSLT